MWYDDYDVLCDLGITLLDDESEEFDYEEDVYIPDEDLPVEPNFFGLEGV